MNRQAGLPASRNDSNRQPAALATASVMARERPRLLLATISLTAILLSGCAATVMSANDKTVVIGKFGHLSVAEAKPLADKQCAEYGKVAKLHYAGARDVYFDCVEDNASH